MTFGLVAMTWHLTLLKGLFSRVYIKSAGHVWQRWDLSTSSSHRGRLHKASIGDGFRRWVPLGKIWFCIAFNRRPWWVMLLDAPLKKHIVWKRGCNHPTLHLNRFNWYALVTSKNTTRWLRHVMIKYYSILQLPKLYPHVLIGWSTVLLLMPNFWHFCDLYQWYPHFWSATTL